MNPSIFKRVAPRLGAILACAALASGCATLTQEECLIGDWAAIGYDDGVRGQPPDRISRHQDACAAHGVGVDLARWRSGYQQGLEIYCTYDNGYDLGVDGGLPTGACEAASQQAFAAWRTGYDDGLSYYCTPENGFLMGAQGRYDAGACRGPLGQGFEIAYDDGRLLRELYDEVEEAREDYRDIDDDLDDRISDRDRALRRLAEDDVGDDEAAQLREQIDDLDEEIGRLRNRRRSASRDVDDALEDFRRLEFTLSLQYPVWHGLD
ncbi:MAG: DUF2799 domain-containing protein [Maricaulaceae bacterium]|jgi:hypothetical protein